MRYKQSRASAALVLLVLIVLVGSERFASHVGASRPASSGRNQGKTITVLIRGFKFDPATVTVHEGDTVKWKNNDFVPHTATEDVNKPDFDSGPIQKGAAWHHVAQNKGTYNYICTLHPNMQGRLVVQ